MAVMEAVSVMIKSVCFAIAHHALSGIDLSEPEVEVEAEAQAPQEHIPPPVQPDGLQGAQPTDHQLWEAEQEMLRRVRPGSPLIDPDYDNLSQDIIQPVDLN